MYCLRKLEDIQGRLSHFIKTEKPKENIEFLKPRYANGRCENLGPGIRVFSVKFAITPQCHDGSDVGGQSTQAGRNKIYRN